MLFLPISWVFLDCVLSTIGYEILDKELQVIEIHLHEIGTRTLAFPNRLTFIVVERIFLCQV